jgi:hypothetical protein
VPIEEIDCPIYLDRDIVRYLNAKRLNPQDNLQSLANQLLHNYIENEKQTGP